MSIFDDFNLKNWSAEEIWQSENTIRSGANLNTTMPITRPPIMSEAEIEIIKQKKMDVLASALEPKSIVEKIKNFFTPSGLTKKPGAMPPGQYKKLIETEAGYLDLSQEAQEIYLDPEGIAQATRYSQNINILDRDEENQKEYNKNAALTAKGFHPAKIPHPMMTHFIAGKK